MMSTIGRLTQSVSSSMKRFFGGLVKQSFWHKFGFQCPKTLHRVKNLSFLPHLMKSTLPWRNIRVSDLQEYLQLSGEQLDDCLVSGDFHLQDYPWLRDVGDELLNYFFFSIAARTITALTVMRSGRKLRHLGIVGSQPKTKAKQNTNPTHKPNNTKPKDSPKRRATG